MKEADTSSGKIQEYLLPAVMTSMAISMASVVDGIIVGSFFG